MNWINVLPQEDLPEGERKVITLEQRKILLIHHEGNIYAVGHVCPHMNLPLKGGQVDDHTLTCPWHRSAFDLTSGDVQDWSPWPPVMGKMLGSLSREKALPVFPTKIEDGAIWVDLDGHDAPAV